MTYQRSWDHKAADCLSKCVRRSASPQAARMPQGEIFPLAGVRIPQRHVHVWDARGPRCASCTGAIRSTSAAFDASGMLVRTIRTVFVTHTAYTPASPVSSLRSSVPELVKALCPAASCFLPPGQLGVGLRSRAAGHFVIFASTQAPPSTSLSHTQEFAPRPESLKGPNVAHRTWHSQGLVSKQLQQPFSSGLFRACLLPGTCHRPPAALPTCQPQSAACTWHGLSAPSCGSISDQRGCEGTAPGQTQRDTIVALSSGAGRSGVAVIRVSGPAAGLYQIRST